MENFDLTRLNSQSFERLVRALAFRIIGTSGTVFSAGPDGGRDFTFEGKVSDLFGKPWDGYVVVQAKFRETLYGSAKDVAWLKTQLALELKKYTNKSRGLRKPDYYIIASNVALSGSDGPAKGGAVRLGGHARISSELEAWKGKIGIKDFDVWSNSKILDLLMDAPNIRQTYAAWVTPGDILSAVLRQLNFRETDFSDLIGRGLRISLRRDQQARLKDAGSVSDATIRLSQVFMDLPVNMPAPRYAEELPEEDVESSLNFVNAIIGRSRSKLDAEAIYSGLGRGSTEPYPKNKIVLLGGPGQGKSTVSMFVAQLFRASMLEHDPKALLDSNVSRLIPEILLRASSQRISLRVPKRYPVYISLPQFADKLSLARKKEELAPSLLMHIAQELGQVVDSSVNRVDVRGWLENYPWIVILDGLDEVPPSGERLSIIESISDFVTETVERNADVLILVTTRPQGYNGDLSEQDWDHWRLADLGPQDALAYASALGEARYPDDAMRQQEILRSLRDAALKPATGRLMVTPLQVTIMHMIVDTGGGVPAARWSLFNDYFEILKRREKSKGGANQKVLERNTTLIGPIHQRAGLVLQTDSEKAGGAVSTLTEEQFGNLMAELLRSEGFRQHEIEERVAEVLQLAIHRLVLLSAHVEGRISFDVRSMQEYMAAAALTSGPGEIVEKRLHHLADKSHWRHVFLIAASRCFNEDSLHHLRSMIIGLPRKIDTDFLNMEAKRGALLSLEMFIDGIAIEHPLSRRQLAQHALECLELGPEALDKRMVELLEDSTKEIILSSLSRFISGGVSEVSLAAWRLILQLAKECPAALELAETRWPDSAQDAVDILAWSDLPLPSSAIISKAHSAVCSVSPFYTKNKLYDSVFVKSMRRAQEMQSHGELFSVIFWLNSDEDIVQIPILPSLHDDPPLRVTFRPVRCARPLKLDSLRHGWHAEWLPFMKSAAFELQPSCIALAEFIRAAVEVDKLKSLLQFSSALPWPLVSAISTCDTSSDALELARKAEEGALGDLSDWEAMEARIAKHGITEKDLLFSCEQALPCPDYAEHGYPSLMGYRITNERHGGRAIFDALFAIVKRARAGKAKERLADIMVFSSYGIHKDDLLDDASIIASALDVFRSNSALPLSRHIFCSISDAVWLNSMFLLEVVKCIQNGLRHSDRSFLLPMQTVLSSYKVLPADEILFLAILSLAFGRDPDRRNIAKLAQIAGVTEATGEVGKISRMIITSLVSRSRDVSLMVERIRRFDKARDSGRQGFGDILLGLIANNLFCEADREEIFRHLLRLYVDRNDLGKIREILKKTLDARTSRLADQAVWLEFSLPRDALELVCAFPSDSGNLRSTQV